MCKIYDRKSVIQINGVGKAFAIEVMQKLNDSMYRMERRKKILIISVYGTPIESTTYKFAKCLQEQIWNN